MSPVQPRRAVPMAAWIVAGVIFTLGFAGLSLLFTVTNRILVPPPFEVIVLFVIPLLLAGYVVTIGFVYNDARRRGMRYVMWMWLAILIPHGFGILLYFIFRDPMPVYCSKCGAALQRGFTYCPHCGSGTGPFCGQCHRVGQPGWSHCAWCGTKM